jgi:hypothetical protein
MVSCHSRKSGNEIAIYFEAGAGRKEPVFVKRYVNISINSSASSAQIRVILVQIL